MEYIYCKNNEVFEHTMRTLNRMGYENQIKYLPYPRAANQLGVTIFLSDVWKIIGNYWRYGFAPYEYGCKPSKALEQTQNYKNETNKVSFNKFANPINENANQTEEVGGVSHKINEPYDSGAWKDLKNRPSNETKHRAKTDIEPLDDTEELKADREKLRKFAKDTKGKAKITLAPMQILKDIAEVREYGVKKYGSVDSWKEVPIEDYRDALLRHIIEYIKDPSGVDRESGIKHYKHIACNLAFICEMENTEDDPTSI